MSLSLHDLYFSTQNKNHMFHIIAQSVKQITDYSILEDDKYIMLYKSNYARIFDETNAETIVEINKKLLDVVGELIIYDLQKTDHKVDTITKPQKKPIANITLSSSMRKLDSKNRYNYTLHVNETMIQIQTITILKENNPLCTSLINVKINNDLLQCEYYESKWFNKRELLIYHPLNTINHEIKDKSIDIQFLSNNMIEIEPQNDIFQIVKLKKIPINDEIYICCQIEDREKLINIGDTIGFFKDNILSYLSNIKNIQNSYLFFEDREIDVTCELLMNISVQNMVCIKTY